MRKKLLKQLFLLPLLAVILYGCLPEDDIFERRPGNNKQRELSPEALVARAWFENEVGKGFLSWYTSDGQQMMLMPHWSHAVSNENEKFRVTEVRMRIRGVQTMVRITAENSQRFQQTGNRRYLATDTRFVLRTDIETGETVGFVMKVNPDVEQVGRNRRQHPLRGFTYLERDRNFTGFVNFYELDGRFANGWRQRGREFTPVFPRAMLENNSQLRSSLSCGWGGVTCDDCIFSCWVWTITIPIIYNGEVIRNEIIEIVCKDSCVWISCPNSSANPPGNSGGGSSGGGSGSSRPPGGSNGGYYNPPSDDDDDDDNEKPEENPITVTLLGVPTEIEVGLHYTMYIRTSNLVVTRNTVRDISFRMKRRGTPVSDPLCRDNWGYQVQGGLPTEHSRIAWTPGYWYVKVFVELVTGRIVYSNKMPVEEQFPSGYRFQSDEDLENHLREVLWPLAIEYARRNRETHRVREYGATIYMTRYGRFYPGTTVWGESVAMAGEEEVTVTISINVSNVPADPRWDCNSLRVGSMHTHFPMTWAAPRHNRTTGASGPDLNAIAPGIGIDYAAPRIERYHCENGETRFFTYGATRMATSTITE